MLLFFKSDAKVRSFRHTTKQNAKKMFSTTDFMGNAPVFRATSKIKRGEQTTISTFLLHLHNQPQTEISK
jgi:hypothetical protein